MNSNLPAWTSDFVQFATVLAIFIFVLVITYFTTRFVGTYEKQKLKGTNMEVLDTCRLGKDKFIHIVRIGKRFVAVAASRENVSVICELEEDELDLSDSQLINTGETFRKLLERTGNMIKKDKGG